MGRLAHALRALEVVALRELLRFLGQRERFFSAMVRPLVWLFIFAAGFRNVLGVSIQEPYTTYVLYELYITPGLVGMILLFSGMQGALSMVYDQEMGSMRVLLVSPLPRWYLLSAKLVGIVFVATLQAYVFLFIARLYGVDPPLVGYLYAFPAILLGGLMLGALGLLLSSVVRQLENFAGVMNFVIFPMFFASSALYPLWQVRESSQLLYEICAFNPFTHVVELIRFALHEKFAASDCAWTLFWAAVFLALAFRGYDPVRGFTARTGKAE
ncbi:MAG: ABC transporter permease [Geminicoccaceae bacterium]|nr:ABC transporter permease [Geminicoccaceae bacterium]MCS7266469.1 ABC transporter permease [Geminicoccaceae bacterium]MCX7629402.1 ABC transporter permease [Geminicoccaceae bacterium]